MGQTRLRDEVDHDVVLRRRRPQGLRNGGDIQSGHPPLQIFGTISEAEEQDVPDAITEVDLRRKLAQPCEDYAHAVTADGVLAAFGDCPKGKMSGRDRRPAEAWNAAFAAEPRLAAATLWAWNARLQNWPEHAHELAPRAHTSADAHGTSADDHDDDDDGTTTMRRRAGDAEAEGRQHDASEAKRRHEDDAAVAVIAPVSPARRAARPKRYTEPTDPWSEADVRLAPKEHRPMAFRLLRPIAILTVSAKKRSRRQ